MKCVDRCLIRAFIQDLVFQSEKSMQAWYNLAICVLADYVYVLITAQRARDAIITSLWRQNDVATPFWHHNDVITASFVRWVPCQHVIANCCRIEWNSRVVIMPTLSPMVAPEVVITTTCGTASDGLVDIMTTLEFQWMLISLKWIHISVIMVDALESQFCWSILNIVRMYLYIIIIYLCWNYCHLANHCVKLPVEFLKTKCVCSVFSHTCTCIFLPDIQNITVASHEYRCVSTHHRYLTVIYF